MSRIGVTGDIHGDAISRFSFKKHKELREFGPEDNMVVVGDCGIPFGVNAPWFNEKAELHQLKWLREQKYNFVFVCGNHDDRDAISAMPQVEKYGNQVRLLQIGDEIAENVAYIDTPGIYTISGEKCLIIPGAESHDIQDGILDPEDDQFENQYKVMRKRNKMFRVNHWSWWEDEKINIELCELKRITEDWDNQFFDLIFTHDAPAFFWKEFELFAREIPTEGELYLEKLFHQLNFEAWVHGHFHVNKLYRENILCLYEQIFLNEEE